MDPVAQSAMAAIADFGLRAEAVRTLKKYAVGPLGRRAARAALLEGAGQRRHRAGDRRAAELRPAASRLALRVPAGHRADPHDGRRGAANGSAARGSSICRWSRCRRSRPISARSDRDPTDVELETVAQTWSEHCSHKTLAGRIHYRDPSGERHFQNMLKETIFAATQKIRKEAGERRLVRQRLFRQRRRDPLRRAVQRRLQGRNAQPSLGPGALRRGEHGHRRRDPRPDGHRHGRQADLQHRRLLLCPARHAGRIAAARRAPSAPRDEGRRRRRPRLRQPHGHPHRQRRALLRSAIPRQSAGLLRQHRPDSARQVVQAPAAGRSDRGRRRADRPRRHPRRHVQLGRTDQPQRNASPAARCRSATPSPRRWCSTCCWSPATAACTTP